MFAITKENAFPFRVIGGMIRLEYNEQAEPALKGVHSMKVLAFAGFLGSGKTTIIKRCIDSILAKGEKVAIIENEIGATSIDDKVLKDGGVEMTTLTGGCVCCTISGSLVAAADVISQQINPDWLIVELTGLAYMTGIREVFAEHGSQYDLKSISVVDIARWFKLLKISRPLLTDQVVDANVIIINKVDIVMPTEEQLEQIGEISHGSPVVLASTEYKDSDIWENICDIINRK